MQKELVMTAVKRKYTCAKTACYMGYITQAAVVNLAPLLFVIFRDNYGVSFEMLARIVLINFVVQIGADILSVKLLRHITLRALAVTAHVFCTVGMVLFSFLPAVMGYSGILLSTAIYALGGGMIEVVVNPVIDACDTDDDGKKSPAAIAILHSFYCWGHVLVVVVSTLFLKFFGNGMWQILPLIWATVPAINTVAFAVARFPETCSGGESLSFKNVFSSKLFVLAAVLMVTAGAAEQAVAQWASIFAEKGLGVSKTVGDLLGPMCFAVCMAIIRIVAGLMGNKLDTGKLLAASSALCVACYCVMVFVKNPIVSLLGCAMCGFAVGFMWPGVLSLAADKIRGGASMFGLLAFFGDVGCSLGPWVAGVASDVAAKHAKALSVLPFFSSMDAGQIGLKCGILAAIVFPILLFCFVLKFKKAND